MQVTFADAVLSHPILAVLDVYYVRTEHTCHKSTSGTLTTSLAEDVLSLVQTQRSVVWGFLESSELLRTEAGEKLLEDAMVFLLSHLKESQVRHRLVFLTTLEDACAAANDFLRMSEQTEGFLCDLYQKYMPLASSNAHRSTPNSTLQQLGESLVSQFSQDAVYAAERTQVFIVRSVQQQTSIPVDLFSKSWEDDWTHNEVIVRLVKIFDTHLVNVQRYLANNYLFQKTLLISARAMVCFYIRCLVQKADMVGRHKHHLPGKIMGKSEKPFRSPKRALIRIRDDICIMSDFYERKAGGNLTLLRMIRNEFGSLEVIRECLGATDSVSLESFIVVIHKRTGADCLVTRHFVGDLVVLMARQFQQKNGSIKHTFDQLQPDLQMVTTRMKEHQPEKVDSEISFVRLDEMLKALYEDRIVQGLMPICWTCLPKDIVQDCDESVVTRRIRKLTRNVAELRSAIRIPPPSTNKSGL